MLFQKRGHNRPIPPYMKYESNGSWEEKQYLNLRLLPQIQYYSKASRQMHNWYYILSLANIVLMAAVPVILLLPDTIKCAKYISASISATASVLSSVLLITRAKENWLEYRASGEALKSELAAFMAGSAEYQTFSSKEKLSLFVERCEGIMQAERTGWYSRMKLEPDQTNGVTGTSEDTGS